MKNKLNIRSLAIWVFIALMGAIPRIAVCWARWGNLGYDETLHIFSGMALFRGDGLISPYKTPLFAYHPLLSVLIGVLNFFGIDPEIASDIIFVLFGTGAAIPVYLLGRDLFSKRIGYVAALITVTMPFTATIIMTSDVTNTEPITLFLLFLSFWLLYSGLSRNSSGRLFLSGAGMGLAYLGRPEAFFWIVSTIALLIGICIKFRHEMKIRLASLSIFTIAATVFMFPYVLWLRIHSGIWVLSMKAGSEILKWGWPENAKDEVAAKIAEFGVDQVEKIGVVEFFLRYPELLITKLSFTVPNYLLSLLIISHFWLIFLALPYIFRMILSFKFGKSNLFLIFISAPLFGLLIATVIPRHLVYWIPILSIFGALAIDSFRLKKYAANLILFSAVAVNIVYNAENISTCVRTTPHKVYREPAEWLKAKSFQDSTGYFPDYVHGALAEFKSYSYDRQDVLPLIVNGRFSDDFMTQISKSYYSNKDLSDALAKRPPKIGKLYLRYFVNDKGIESRVYSQRTENPVSIENLTAIGNISSLPILLYIDGKAIENNIFSVGRKEEANFVEKLRKNIEASGQAGESIFSDLNKLYIPDFNEYGRSLFRERLAKYFRNGRARMVVFDDEAGLSSITAEKTDMGNPPNEFFNPAQITYLNFNYGRLVYYNRKFKRIGYVNLQRMVSETSRGKQIVQKAKNDFGQLGLDIKLLGDDIYELERSPSGFYSAGNAFSISEKRRAREDKIAYITDLMVPTRLELNAIADNIIAGLRVYGEKNGFGAIISIGDFESLFDPENGWQEISLDDLGLE